MRRRDFMAASLLAGLAPLGHRAEAADDSLGREYYELRHYRLASKAKRNGLCSFLGEVAVPALNRIGIEPVGVFRPAEDEKTDVYVLLPHQSSASFLTLTQRLGNDYRFISDGAEFLGEPLSDPAYERFESSLMVAFDGYPRLQLPTKAEGRIFELRTYESHSVSVGQTKVEMFNTGGELEIFRRVGLTSVFFGETIIGARMPNLTYLLGFDDMAAREEAWQKFRTDSQWDRLKRDPKYKDTVSNITNPFLKPMPSSQI